VFYDVTEVMSDYMDLLAGTDSCLSGRPVEQVVEHEFRSLGHVPQTLRLSAHGTTRLADCVRNGQRAGCRFALGFRTVWGHRRGESLF
jgi:hypothetical protein